MRTHREIVQAHGASALVRDLKVQGVEVSQTTPQRWADRDSIPGEYWHTLAQLGVSTLDELARSAAASRAPLEVEARPLPAGA